MQIDAATTNDRKRPSLPRALAHGLLLAVLAVGAIACSSDRDAGEKRAAAKASKETPRKSNAALAEEEAIRNMVAAVPAGKGGSDVDVRFEIAEAPQVGKPTSVRLAIVPTESCNTLEVVFRAEGFELASGGAMPSVSQPAVGVALRHEVTIVPRSDGIFTLTAVVMTESGDGSLARTYSIPVIVGLGVPDAPASAPPATAQATGQTG